MLKEQRLKYSTPARQRPPETVKEMSLESARDVIPAGSRGSRKSFGTLQEDSRSCKIKIQYFVYTAFHLKQATLTRHSPGHFQLLAAARRGVRGANRWPREHRNGSKNKEKWQQIQRQRDVVHRIWDGGVDESERDSRLQKGRREAWRKEAGKGGGCS